jgi:Mg2+ and Co2+ transporter CorA
MAEQLEEMTDCEALLQLIDEFIDEFTKMIEDFIQEQLEILKEELPLLDIPTSITQIIGWIKKLVLGRILPRLEAYIKLIKKIAEFTFALQRLLSVIQSLPDKLERCAAEVQQDLVTSLETRVQNAITSVSAPIDDTLAEVDGLQNQLENILENPLNERIVTDSLDGFLASVDSAQESIKGQADEEINKPLPEPTTFSGSADVANTASLEMEDGLIVGVTEANTA